MSETENDTDPERGRLRSIVESLLFALGEPVSLARLDEAIEGFDRKEIRKALDDLAAEYESESRGLRIVPVAGGFQLRTAAANSSHVRKALAQRPARLSRVALETLAIVAYRQPVTRAEIEAVRGVTDAGAVLSTLLDRRLVRILGRKETVGRPLLYGTTTDFLEIFGLEDLSALPTLEELGESVEGFERALREAEEAAAEAPPPEASPESESS